MTHRATLGPVWRWRGAIRRSRTAPHRPVEETSDEAPERAWLARWTGFPLDRLFDGAGRYRRIAAGLVLLAPPLAEMGLAGIGNRRWEIYGLAHLALAGSCLWLAADLVRTGSLVDHRFRYRPHLSCVAMGPSVLLIEVLRPGGFDGLAPNGWAAPAMIVLLLAVVLLVVSDRRSDIVASVAGRYLGVIGGCGLAAVTWIRSMQSIRVEPAYAIGLGVMSLIVLATALSEGWLLARGVALLRLRLRR